MTFKEPDTKEQFLHKISYSQPYTLTDIEEAIELGKRLTIKELYDKMILLPINGVAQNAITETMLKEMSEKI